MQNKIVLHQHIKVKWRMIMAETLGQLSDANMIASHVYRMLMSAAQYPEFHPGNVPVKVAARVFGKSEIWVRRGMLDGWLDIGIANEGDTRCNVYISPKKLWELTGFIWRGETA